MISNIAPKDRPILFSTPMVQAILDGRKVQTRRVAKSNRPPINILDKLWVRETWAEFDYRGLGIPSGLPETGYDYKATPMHDAKKWKPSIFMPKVAARIWLEVTNVKAERLQTISIDDCIEEGIETKVIDGSVYYRNYLAKEHQTMAWISDAKFSFETLWKSINGRHSWNSNPIVWVYKFRNTNRTLRID